MRTAFQADFKPTGQPWKRPTLPALQPQQP